MIMLGVEWHYTICVQDSLSARFLHISPLGYLDISNTVMTRSSHLTSLFARIY